MKKVMRFIKRRICPIMLALVIVFFSVVIPCAKVEAASVAVPVDGFTYFDLVYTLFYTTGFEASIMKEDGTQKTFTEEMYDELCDCFDIWCYQNFETTDADEIKDQLRALPDQIVDGAVSVSKTLWEAVQSWASDAYDDYCNYKEITSKYESYRQTLDSYPFYRPFGYVQLATSSSCHYYYYFANDTKIVCFVLGGCFEFYAVSSEPISYAKYDPSTHSFSYNQYSTIANSLYYLKLISDSGPDVPTSLYGCVVVPYPDNIYNYFSSFSGIDDIGSDLAPDVIWPQQDLAIDKVKNPTWDDAIASDVVVPGEVADTGTIAIEDTPTDSVPIPGTIDVPDVKDDPTEDEKEEEEEEEEEGEKENTDETVTDEEIGTLPDKVAAAGDITKLFPFCIPFDLVALIKGMKAQEKAPVWHFKYYFKDINYTFEFTVDMTDYETYIKIFRAGMVIFWIITLMFITIRYSSGIAKD